MDYKERIEKIDELRRELRRSRKTGLRLDERKTSAKTVSSFFKEIYNEYGEEIEELLSDTVLQFDDLISIVKKGRLEVEFSMYSSEAYADYKEHAHADVIDYNDLLEDMEKGMRRMRSQMQEFDKAHSKLANKLLTMQRGRRSNRRF